jgi:triphosphoribosyl-dephospho-CoA synthase
LGAEHELVAFADEVMRAGQLAAALEASAYPKPGNVNRFSDRPPKRLEHFIAGSIALGPALREAAVMGASAGLYQVEVGGIGVGRLVKRAVADVARWQRGGNTHLGVALLFIPLAAGAGLTYARRGKVGLEGVREGAVEVMRGSTVEDAVEVYEAIALAKPSGLGVFEGEAPDIADPAFRGELASRGLTLLKVMEEASRWDDVARELAGGFEATFNLALPELLSVLRERGDLRLAVAQSYVKLLASRLDTFIARCVGVKVTQRLPDAVEAGRWAAEEVRRMAEEALRLGGALTPEGVRALERMDAELKARGGDYNPGSTADIVAAALFVAIMCGARP